MCGKRFNQEQIIAVLKKAKAVNCGTIYPVFEEVYEKIPLYESSWESFTKRSKTLDI